MLGIFTDSYKQGLLSCKKPYEHVSIRDRPEWGNKTDLNQNSIVKALISLSTIPGRVMGDVIWRA